MRIPNSICYDLIISPLTALFVMNCIVASSLLIAFKLSGGLAVVSSICLALLAVVCSIFLQKWFLSWTALIAVVASLLCGMYLSDYADLQGREIVRDISIAEAANYPEAAGYTFTDGFVKSDLRATYQKKVSSATGPTTITYYYAAPVVDKNWDPSKPVSLFAVQEIAYDPGNWKHSFRAGIRAQASSYYELQAAVDQCIRAHNLVSGGEQVLIEWVQSPEKAIAKYKDALGSTLLIWNIVLIATIFLFRIISLLRKKKTNSEKSEATAAESKGNISGRTLFQILFSFYCLYLLVFSLYFSGYDFTRFVPIVLLVLSLILYILATGALQIAHDKEERSLSDFLYVAVYPYLVYFLTFSRLDFDNSFLWFFCGFFYFFIISGGFVFGIIFSLLFARRDVGSSRDTDRHLERGKRIIKAGRNGLMLLIFSGGIFSALTVVFLRLAQTVENIEPYRVVLFYFFLTIGIWAIVRFTHRHTVFNISKDPSLRKKYRSE